MSGRFFERLERLVRRIRVAPAYNPSVGAVLGITRTTQRIADPRSYVPLIKVIALARAYTFNVRCPVRSFNGFIVSYRRISGEEWHTTMTNNNSPAVVRLTPTEPGRPEQIYVRTQMVKGYFLVSQYSSSTVVTVNP